jgi:hypothetical protein
MIPFLTGLAGGAFLVRFGVPAVAWPFGILPDPTLLWVVAIAGGAILGVARLTRPSRRLTAVATGGCALPLLLFGGYGALAAVGLHGPALSPATLSALSHAVAPTALAAMSGIVAWRLGGVEKSAA